jgi:hypothetical protein
MLNKVELDVVFAKLETKETEKRIGVPPLQTYYVPRFSIFD